MKKNNYYSIKTTRAKKYTQKKMCSKNIGIFFLLWFLLSVLIAFTRIPEGHVGVYSINDQIQDKLITSTTFYSPFFSKIELVKFIQKENTTGWIKRAVIHTGYWFF